MLRAHIDPLSLTAAVSKAAAKASPQPNQRPKLNRLVPQFTYSINPWSCSSTFSRTRHSDEFPDFAHEEDDNAEADDPAPEERTNVLSLRRLSFPVSTPGCPV
eukprot:1858866-Amphidinium_carterae.1